MTDKQRLWLLELTGYNADDYESGFVLHLDGFRVCIHRDKVPFGVMGDAYYDKHHLIGGWYKKIELTEYGKTLPKDIEGYMDKLILEDAKDRLFLAGDMYKTLVKELYHDQ